METSKISLNHLWISSREGGSHRTKEVMWVVAAHSTLRLAFEANLVIGNSACKATENTTGQWSQSLIGFLNFLQSLSNVSYILFHSFIYLLIDYFFIHEFICLFVYFEDDTCTSWNCYEPCCIYLTVSVWLIPANHFYLYRDKTSVLCNCNVLMHNISDVESATAELL